MNGKKTYIILQINSVGNKMEEIIKSITEAVAGQIAPLQKKVDELYKDKQANEMPELDHEVWTRVVRKSFGDNYKIN